MCRVSQNIDFTEAGNGRNVQPTDCMQCCWSWGWVALYSVVSYMRCACVTEKGGKMHVPKIFFLPKLPPQYWWLEGQWFIIIKSALLSF